MKKRGRKRVWKKEGSRSEEFGKSIGHKLLGEGYGCRGEEAIVGGHAKAEGLCLLKFCEQMNQTKLKNRPESGWMRD